MFIRKNTRAKDYDYSSEGAYFITICTANKQLLLGSLSPANDDRTFENPEVKLSKIGLLTQQSIKSIPDFYPFAAVDKYIIMPNHIHMILIINEGGIKSLSTIIGQLKRNVSKQAGINVWQKSFYDHIIRNEQDYNQICEYIDSNPAKWTGDMYYV
jgi:putative transposase